MLNGAPVDALATIVHKDKAMAVGRRLCVKIKEKIRRWSCCDVVGECAVTDILWQATV